MKPVKLDSGKWQAKYYVYLGGKRVTRSAGTFSTKRDAQDKIDEELAKHRRGEWTDNVDRKVTVGDWSERWYATRLMPSRKYRSFLDSRLLPYWRDWRLDEVEDDDMAAWVASMVREGLAPATVHDYYDIARMIFGEAVSKGRIVRNPCRLKAHQLPKTEEGTFVFLTVEETRVLTALAPERFRALVHLAVWTGMRIGELMALRWDAVDLEAGAVQVLRAAKTSGYGAEGLPKGDKTRRIVIDAATVDVLRAHRRDFGSSDYVFTTTRGGRRLSYANFRTQVWVPLVEAAFDGRITPTIHDLRHTHCGLMIAQGMDWMILSKRMGHHAPSFTMDRYGHRRHDHEDVTLKMLEAAAGLSMDLSIVEGSTPTA